MGHGQTYKGIAGDRHSPKKVGNCVDNYMIYIHIGIVDVPTIEFVITESTTYPHDDNGNLL